MPISQNLRFAAVVPRDKEFDHPAGATLMRLLLIELKIAGWSTNEMDNWRDCGWATQCRRGSSKLEVVVSQIQEAEWMLQITPHHTLGFISRLFGGKPSAKPTDAYELAMVVHRSFSKLQYVSRLRWRWDGFPDEKHSTSEPQAP